MRDKEREKEKKWEKDGKNWRKCKKKTGTTLCILIYSLFVLLFFPLCFTFYASFFFLLLALHLTLLVNVHWIILYVTFCFVSCSIYSARWLILFSISSVFVCIRVWLSNFSEARRKWFYSCVSASQNAVKSQTQHNNAWQMSLRPSPNHQAKKKRLLRFLFRFFQKTGKWTMVRASTMKKKRIMKKKKRS